MWDVWRRGDWPFMDWLTAPLYLLAQMNAIDVTYKTVTYMATKNSDWSKLTATQMELAKWLNK